MREEILQYIKEQFSNKEFTTHYSYCKFPEENCTCNNLNDIDYDTSLIRGGYIDSFSMLAVLIFIEQKFNINVPEREATPDNFDTINKMIDLINKHKK